MAFDRGASNRWRIPHVAAGNPLHGLPARRGAAADPDERHWFGAADLPARVQHRFNAVRIPMLHYVAGSHASLDVSRSAVFDCRGIGKGQGQRIGMADFRGG